MRFLADESCDFRVVRALRAAGHDVVSIIERSPGADDLRVVDMALQEQRILITEDRDFGQLFYATARPGPGVILLRFPSGHRASLPSVVTEVVAEHADKLQDRFLVLEPGRARFGRLPRE
jgi:predicted nuclease of predicted toxin-antitoxin system